MITQERERCSYSIKEHSWTNVYCRICGITPKKCLDCGEYVDDLRVHCEREDNTCLIHDSVHHEEAENGAWVRYEDIERLTAEVSTLKQICAAWSISFQKLSAKSGLPYAETSKLLPGEIFPDLPTVSDRSKPLWTNEPSTESGWYWWKHKLSAPYSEPKRYDIGMVRGGYWWPCCISAPTTASGSQVEALDEKGQ